MDGADFERFLARLVAERPFLPEATARRLARAYGTRVEQLLGDARALSDLGETFGGDLSTREVAYLVRHEWARTSDDVLWRRSKLGLRIGRADVARLGRTLAAQLTDPGAQRP
jgi:glycerol-3-phosphate dehydrogenase